MKKSSFFNRRDYISKGKLLKGKGRKEKAKAAP
jgi:hypothetical protein